MSKIHFVGGDKGGVGKSVVARLLVEWCLDRGVAFAAFDADTSHGALLRHYPGFTRAVDLARFDSADAIMTSACETDRRVVVDLPAQGDGLLAAWIAEGQILDLAAESGVGITFWQVMDDGKDAVAALGRSLARHPPPARLVIVENMGRGVRFALFDRSPARAVAAVAGVPTIQCPELHAAVMRKIDRTDASFGAVIHDVTFAAESFTRADRQRVKVWLQGGFGQIARLGDWP